MKKDFLISVIVSTYNRPDMLLPVLDALCAQTDRHFEIVVADDGSRDDTRAVVDSVRERAPVPVIHAWHEDLGFRLSAVRNLAFRQSHGDYLIFIDGDSVPPSEWIARHRAMAEPGWTVPCQRIFLSERFGGEVLSAYARGENLLKFDSASLSRMKARGDINRVWPAHYLSLGFLRKLTPRKWLKVRGCNWAMWRTDYEACNGFDESFEGWGGEDSDLAVRLMNKGVRIKSGTCGAAVFHIWHKEAPRDRYCGNWKTVEERLRSGETQAARGLRQAKDA